MPCMNFANHTPIIYGTIDVLLQAGDLWTSLVYRHWKEVNNDTELGMDIWNEVCMFEF